MNRIRGSEILLDEKSPTAVIGGKLRRPGFQQIVEDLRARIARSELAEHASLPSERSLAEQFSVSRMTARRALEALEAEGLVYSQDRRGRFVSPQRLQYDVSNMVSFVADARTKGSDLDIEIVGVGEVAADVRLASLLEQPVGVPIYEYTRLFRSGGHAIFIETECVLADRFPGFLQHDLQQSTTRILETHYNSAAQTGDIVIRMRGVCEDEAKLLNISNNHAVILLEQVIRDQTGAPFCFGRQVWRGEMAEFSAHAIVTRKNHR